MLECTHASLQLARQSYTHARLSPMWAHLAVKVPPPTYCWGHVLRGWYRAAVEMQYRLPFMVDTSKSSLPAEVG